VQETPARAALLSFLAAAYGGGAGAEEEYERELARLRGEPDAAVVEIAQLLGATPSRDFPTRFALIHAATELRHASAISLLASVAETPVPPEPSQHSHSFSMTANETILRTTAVEGLGQLARTGERGARDALFRCLRHSSLSVRRAAVHAILAGGRRKTTLARVRAVLPPDDHFLVELAQPTVHEVPQVKNPKRFLSEEARQRQRADPPDPLAPSDPSTNKAPKQ
jgi:HEAT repeat protein